MSNLRQAEQGATMMENNANSNGSKNYYRGGIASEAMQSIYQQRGIGGAGSPLASISKRSPSPPSAMGNNLAAAPDGVKNFVNLKEKQPSPISGRKLSKAGRNSKHTVISNSATQSARLAPPSSTQMSKFVSNDESAAIGSGHQNQTIAQATASKNNNITSNYLSNQIQQTHEMRLHEIYGSELKQLQSNSLNSPSMQPLAASFRKRQALLNEKLAGLAKVKVTMAKSAERVVHDVDMPTIVKGLLDQLPSHKISAGPKGSLLGVVAVNRVDSGKFESKNFTSTNLMRQLGGNKQGTFNNNLTVDLRAKNKSDLEYQSNPSCIANTSQENLWQMVSSPTQKTSGTFERFSPRPGQYPDHQLQDKSINSRNSKLDCRSIDNVWEQSQQNVAAATAFIAPSPTFGSHKVAAGHQQRAKSNIDMIGTTQQQSGVTSGATSPQLEADSSTHQMLSNGIMAVSRLAANQTILPNDEDSSQNPDRRCKQRQFKSPYEQRLPLLHVKAEVNRNAAQQNQSMTGATLPSQNNTPSARHPPATRGSIIAQSQPPQPHHKQAATAATSLIAASNSYRAACSGPSSAAASTTFQIKHNNTLFKESQKQNPNSSFQKKGNDSNLVILQPQNSRLRETSEAVAEKSKRLQQLLDSTSNSNNMMMNDSTTMPTSQAKIQLQPVVGAPTASSGHQNAGVTSKTLQGNLLVSALNSSHTVTGNAHNTTAHSLPLANLSFSSAKVGEQQQHNRYLLQNVNQSQQQQALYPAQSYNCSSMGAQTDEPALTNQGVVYGPWSPSKSHTTKKQQQNSLIQAAVSSTAKSNKLDSKEQYISGANTTDALNKSATNRATAAIGGGSTSLTTPVKPFMVDRTKQQQQPVHQQYQDFGEYVNSAQKDMGLNRLVLPRTHEVRDCVQKQQEQALNNGTIQQADQPKAQQQLGENFTNASLQLSQDNRLGPQRIHHQSRSIVAASSSHHHSNTTSGVSKTRQMNLRTQHQQMMQGGGELMHKQSQPVNRNSNYLATGVLSTYQQQSANNTTAPSKKKAGGNEMYIARPRQVSQSGGSPMAAANRQLDEKPSTYEMKIAAAVISKDKVAALKSQQNQQPYGQVAGSQKFNPFILDSNPPTLPIQTPQQTVSSKHHQSIHYQKTLSEVRPSAAVMMSYHPHSQQKKSSLLFDQQSANRQLSNGKNEVGKMSTSNGPVGAAAKANDPLSKALHFQQLGEYFAKQAMPVPVANQGTSNAQKANHMNYSKLKRVADLVVASGSNTTGNAIYTQQTESSSLATALKQQKGDSLVILSQETAAIMRKSIDKQKQPLPSALPPQQSFTSTGVQQKTAGNNGSLKLDGSNDTWKDLISVGKAATYSPRKSLVVKQHKSQRSSKASLTNGSQADPAQKQASMTFTTGVNQATAQEPAKSNILQIDSGTQQLKLLTSPDIVVDEQNKSKLHQASSESLNERASSVQLNKHPLSGLDETEMVPKTEEESKLLLAADIDAKAVKLQSAAEYQLQSASGQPAGQIEEKQRPESLQQRLEEQLQEETPNMITHGRSSRNKQAMIANKGKDAAMAATTENMNTNSSDGGREMSQNHSEDNLNHLNHNIVVEGKAGADAAGSIEQSTNSIIAANLPLTTGQQLKPRQSHRKFSPQKLSSKQKGGGHGGPSLGQNNRGRRNNKRKITTRSVISSKPSLHSNYSRVQATVTNQTAQQAPQVTSAANNTATVPVPAVHDLNNNTKEMTAANGGGKFVTDPRRIDSYYNKVSGPAAASKKSGSSQAQKRQNNAGAGNNDEEYLMNSVQNPIANAPTAAVLSEKHSSYGGSRAGKRQQQPHIRKNSHSMACQSSHLSSTKSQPKILTRHSRASQRSSSAVRSPTKPLQSQSTITTNHHASKRQQQTSAAQQQPAPSSAAPASATSSRPKTVINQKAASKQQPQPQPSNLGAKSPKAQVPAESKGKGLIADQQRPNDNRNKKEKKSIMEGQNLMENQPNDQNNDIINADLAKAVEKQPLIPSSMQTSLADEIDSRASVEPKSPLNTGKPEETQEAADQKEAKAEEVKNQRVRHDFAEKGEQILIEKKDILPTTLSKTEINIQESIKASQVKRVRQIQNSQKTLECKTRGTNSTTAPRIAPPTIVTTGQTGRLEATNRVKEPMSATKVPSKNQLQSTFSMMSRCASVASKTIANNKTPGQKQPQNAAVLQKMASLNETCSGEEVTSESNVMQAAKDAFCDSIASRPSLLQENSTNGVEIKEKAQLSVLQSYEQYTETIDEEIEEIAVEKSEKLHQRIMAPLSAANEEISGFAARQSLLQNNPKAKLSPYCTMSVMIDGSEPKLRDAQMLMSAQIELAEQQRLTTTLAPKSGSSMKQHQQMRSFQNDDEYIVSATSQPYCSCKSYVIIDSHHSKVLQSKNKDEVREMASLTKMMTALVSLELAQEMRLDIRSTYFKVSIKAATTIGTTANLVDGQVVSIWDLLHGLMLPSGNDAAMVLAENFSERLQKLQNRQQRASENQPAACTNLKAPECGVSYFVKVMNKTARRLHMRLTNYANPHGLADKSNHSTAFELAYLANQAMKNETFRQIVNTKTFTSINYMPLKRAKRLPNHEFTQWQQYDDRDVPFPHGDMLFVQYHQTWYNSNKLLDQPGFCGVKTGQTSTAGCCLAIYYRNTIINKNLVTVVLGSKSIEYRWKDTRRLTLWADAILMDEHAKKSSPTKVGTNAMSKRQALPGFRT